MLILTRKPGESLYIGDVKVTIVELKGHQIRIGIDAPPEIRIYREEIYLQILEENKKAAEAAMTSESDLQGISDNWDGRHHDKARHQGASPVFDRNDGNEGDTGMKKPRISTLSSVVNRSTNLRSSIPSSKGEDEEQKRRESPDVVIKRKRKENP